MSQQPPEQAVQPDPEIPEHVRANAPEPVVTITRIELPTRTIFKVLATLAVLWFLWTINGILLQLFVAALLAAAMYPPIRWMVGHGVSRAVATMLTILTVIGALAGLIFVIAQPLVEQGRELAEDFPRYVEEAERLLRTNPDLYDQVSEAADSGPSDPGAIAGGVIDVGQGAISAISTSFIVLILAVYILLEGGRMTRWLTRDLAGRQQDRIQRLIPALVDVVSGYIIGQLITSALFGVFAFATLTILDVPQPLLLAIVAAFADAIPIIGVPIATIPAVLLAFTVSWETALIVGIAYIAYQQLENYVIVPRVYQGTLQISSFAILLAVLIGTTLLGVIGALLALPVAAAIPVIARVWLNEELPHAFARAAGDVSEGGNIAEASEQKITGPKGKPYYRPTLGRRKPRRDRPRFGWPR
ncbi:MAG TPA: AI-2E family transporter [Thermomicrobiales bacterium]|jgi:predicted PurR-regulated permease PerM|nr:AI-2E family transporter [Thermomicrobiales bacterium]